MKSKLQIAIDDQTMDQTLELLRCIEQDIDIIEIGTPFMMEYGMNAVRKIRKEFPKHKILCDSKIMDAGAYETKLALRAGADYVTVLALADDATIQEAVESANSVGASIVADMISVTDFAGQAERLEQLGVEVLAVHTGVDMQAAGRTPLKDLQVLRTYVKKAKVAVAGGISEQTIDEYLREKPDIIIVGGGITHAADPVEVVGKLVAHIRKER